MVFTHWNLVVKERSVKTPDLQILVRDVPVQKRLLRFLFMKERRRSKTVTVPKGQNVDVVQSQTKTTIHHKKEGWVSGDRQRIRFKGRRRFL